MRVLKIVILVLFGLIALIVIGAVIFLKTFDINRYRPQIIAAASSSLGRTIQFDELELNVSLRNGIHASMANLAIGEHPAFGEDNFLFVKKIMISVDLLAWILKKEIALGRIQILEPRVTIIRETDGRLNARAFAAAGENKQDSSAPVAALPALLIQALEIQDGQITWIDRSSTSPVETRVNALDLSVKGFSLSESFLFSLSAGILNPEPDIQISGQAQLDLLKSAARLHQVKITTEFSKWNLAELGQVLAHPGEFSIPELLEGKLVTTLEELDLNADGVQNLKVDLQWINGAVRFAETRNFGPMSVSEINLSIDDFSFEQPFNVQIAAALLGETPNLSLKGILDLDSSTKSLAISDTILNFDLGLLPLDALRATRIVPDGMPFPENSSGKIELDLRRLRLGTEGITDLMADLKFTDGQLFVTNIAPGINLSASQISLDVKKIAFDQPFSLKFSSSLFSDQPNLDLDGQIRVSRDFSKVNLDTTTMKLNLSALRLDELRSSMGVFRNTPFPQQLAGEWRLTIRELTAGKEGLVSILADTELTDAAVTIRDLAPGVDFAADQMDFSLRNLSLDSARPVHFTLQAACFDERPNLFVGGQTSLDLKTLSARLSDTLVELDLNHFSPARLKEQISLLQGLLLPEILDGKIQVSVESALVDAKGLSDLKLNGNWKDGRMVLGLDETAAPWDLSHIDLTIDGLTTGSESFAVSLGAALQNDQPNFRAHATVTPDWSTAAARLTGVTFESDLAKIDLERLKSTLPALQTTSLPTRLEGQLSARMDELSVSPRGVSSIQGLISLSNGSVVLKELPRPVEAIDLRTLVTDSRITIENLAMAIGDGRMSIQGVVQGADWTRPDYTFTAQAQNLSISDLVDQSQAAHQMHGKISMSLKVTGHGIDPTVDLSTLSGAGEIIVSDGKLTNINVLRLVLDKLSIVPNLRSRLEADLPERFQALLLETDTRFAEITLTPKVKNGTVDVSPIAIDADGFLFEGRGQARFDQTWVLDGAFIIPTDLATAMANAVSEMRYLFDNQQQIQFPLKVTGRGAEVNVMPDISRLGTTILKNTGTEALLRAIGVKSPTVPETSSPAGQENLETRAESTTDNPVPAPEKPAEQILLEGVFDTIFGN